jgi:serine/threonine protein kinase
MPLSLEQFAKSLAASGLMTAEEIKAFHASLPAEKRKDVPHFATELVRGGKLTRYQAATIYQGGTLSLVMGDYRILDKIGAGGMGQVFKAEHRRMKRVVALKLVPAEVTKDAQALKRFQREVETAARLIHPNIVTAYDAGEHQGVHYLIMEFVDGQDLSSLVKKQGTLPIETAVNFIAQAARGLEHAHAEGIIHRDIKPGNLLVDKKGIVKVLDMGLARVDDRLASREKADAVEGLTNSGVLMGTVDYMSPEQAIDTHQADHRADIYSLGCTLFYLLTGRRMFEGETLMKRILAHRDADRPTLSSLRPDMPAALEAIFQRMVAKTPEERYPSMAACRKALEDCLARLDSDGDSSVLQFDEGADEDLASFLKSMKGHTGMATTQARLSTETLASGLDLETRPDSKSHKLAPPASRHRFPVAVTAVLAAAAAVVATGIVLLNRPQQPAPGQQTSTASANVTATPSAAPPTPITAPEPEAPETVEFKPPRTSLRPRREKPAESKPEPPSEPPVQPEAPQAPAAPKKIIVGVGQDEVKDLASALEQAATGDTILIRHRGPLVLPPVDLANKSPLTIAGDAIDGVDFWPLIVQGPPAPKPDAAETNTSPPEVPGLLHGKQLDLTLKKLHLAAGGPASQQVKMGAVFAIGEGRLRIEDCSLTVGSEGTPADTPGPPLPLILVTSAPGERVELSLERVFARGPRLGACVFAAGTGSIKLDAQQVLWAGAAAPWISATEIEGPLDIGLKQSTIYSTTSLLAWESKTVAPSGEPLVRVAASDSLIVGPYAYKEPLVSWNASNPQADLAKAVHDGHIAWEGEGNVYHRFAGYYREPPSKTLASLTKWKSLWGQPGPTVARESDPHFRVWPTGYLLQEAASWDFEARFWRNRDKPRQIAEAVGATVAMLPAALPRSFSRPAAPADVAGKPRGAPRVLVVHLRDGPYKTIEAALAEARDGDIVEIADNGPYTPQRNFTINPGDSVLESKVDCLTIRAGRDAAPVVMLSEEKQEGTASSTWMGNWAVFLAARNRTALILDGLHFRMPPSSTARHRTALATQEVSLLRTSNCSFVVPLPNPAQYLGTLPAVLWLENSVFYNSAAKIEEELVQVRSSSGSDQRALLWSSRNCLFYGDALGYHATSTQPERKLLLSLQGNTFVGRIAHLKQTGALTTDCSENLAMAPEAVFKFEDDNIWRAATKRGDRNALWIGLRALTDQERTQFTNSLLPGPPLRIQPTFETSGVSRDPLRQFRPKKTGVLAADGADVGVRFDYLPEIPPEK